MYRWWHIYQKCTKVSRKLLQPVSHSLNPGFGQKHIWFQLFSTSTSRCPDVDRLIIFRNGKSVLSSSHKYSRELVLSRLDKHCCKYSPSFLQIFKYIHSSQVSRWSSIVPTVCHQTPVGRNLLYHWNVKPQNPKNQLICSPSQSSSSFLDCREQNLKLFDLASNCFGPQLKDLFKDCLISVVHKKVLEEVILIVHDWTTDDIAYKHYWHHHHYHHHQIADADTRFTVASHIFVEVGFALIPVYLSMLITNCWQNRSDHIISISLSPYHMTCLHHLSLTSHVLIYMWAFDGYSQVLPFLLYLSTFEPDAASHVHSQVLLFFL